jgi:hypothetical protein
MQLARLRPLVDYGRGEVVAVVFAHYPHVAVGRQTGQREQVGRMSFQPGFHRRHVHTIGAAGFAVARVLPQRGDLVETFVADVTNVTRHRHPIKSRNPALAAVLGGAPSGFRTPDPLIKSQLLYQLS